MNYHKLCDEVNIGIVGQHFVHPVLQDVVKPLVGDEPGRVEGERERSLVGVVVTVEVVHQQVSELVPDKEENVRCALGLMVPDNPKVVHQRWSLNWYLAINKFRVYHFD